MKKKLTLVVTCVVLVAAMVIGGTLAYFTDTKSAENTFTMGNVKITLDETDVKNPRGGRVTKNDYGTMQPGQVVVKDPVIHNKGANNAYVRAKVTVTGDRYNGGYGIMAEMFKNCTTNGNFDVDKAFIEMVGSGTPKALGNGWSLVSSKLVGDGLFYAAQDVEFVLEYNGVLAAGADTSAMFSQVEIPADFDLRTANNSTLVIEGFKINVVAEAIQANGFVETTDDDGNVTSAMDNAWAAFDAQVKN